MNKQVSPNLVAIVLIAFTVVILAILPVSIQITPNATRRAGSDCHRRSTGMSQIQPGRTRSSNTPSKRSSGRPRRWRLSASAASIDGQINPHLTANVGDTVRITVINGDPVLHNLKIDEFNVFTGELTAQDQQVTVEFVARSSRRFRLLLQPARSSADRHVRHADGHGRSARQLRRCRANGANGRRCADGRACRRRCGVDCAQSRRSARADWGSRSDQCARRSAR